MMNEFWTSLTATIVGGAIASLSAIAAITYGKKLDRKDHRFSLLIDAYAEWSLALEEQLSHHSNYFNLVQQKTQAETSESKDIWKRELVETSKKAGNAGRILDAAQCRLLFLETRTEFRSAVSSITKDSMAEELELVDTSLRGPPFRKLASELRNRMQALLKDLAKHSM